MKRRDFLKKIGLVSGAVIAAPLVVGEVLEKSKLGKGVVQQIEERGNVIDYDEFTQEDLDKAIYYLKARRGGYTFYYTPWHVLDETDFKL